jgi:hypothetical protein
VPVNSWIRFWIRSRNHMQPGNRYFPLRLGTRIFPAAGGICFSWGIPYSYYWFPRRFPRSSLGFGYIHRTHSNHPFSSQNRVGLKVYRPTPQQRYLVVPVYVQNVSTPAGPTSVQIFGAYDSAAPNRATCTIVSKRPKEKTGKNHFIVYFSDVCR